MGVDRDDLQLPAPLEDPAWDDEAAVPRVLPVVPPRDAASIPSRYRHSASAAIVAAGLLGLRDIIDPPPQDETVEEQHAAAPAGPTAMEVYLDPDDPGAGLVVIRDPAELN